MELITRGFSKRVGQIILGICFFWLAFSNSAYAAKFLILEGLIPGQYIKGDKNSYQRGVVVVNTESRMIEMVTAKKENILKARVVSNSLYIPLRRGGKWDVIYPGLIDLHNHTKQNNLGVWPDAKGQFANRFEWRAWSNYKKTVSGNMNPWISYGTAVTCAAFRWSEIQAMTLGGTYLQGPSSCVDDFGIQRVETSSSYVSQKKNVQAPTDLVIPGDMVFVWNTLGPLIRDIQVKSRQASDGESYQLAYEEAFARVVNRYCDFGSKGIVIDRKTVRGEALVHLKNKDLLAEICTGDLPEKFIRYVYWVHKSVIGKKLYAESIGRGKGAAIIAHLAEGRREDPYNNREFQIVQLLGMDQKHVNFVHGVGITEAGLKVMGQKQMGMIWSPYSNFLLYGETLDLKAVLRNNVLLALGSDWLPTGSKGPLEELKIARQYIAKANLQKFVARGTGSETSDEGLFKMVTEHPAKMINHWQQGADTSAWQNGESQGGIGTLIKGAMGSLIVTSQLDDNPYTNLVRDVWQSDINLVVVDGKIQYGNQSYLEAADLEFEPLPNGEHNMAALQSTSVQVPFLPGAPMKKEKEDFLVRLGQLILEISSVAEAKISCSFDEPKGFVHQNTLGDQKNLQAFYEKSGLNLDRFSDIQRLLGINLMTQSRNLNDPEKGDPEFAIKDFTPIFTCNDPKYQNRLRGFVNPDPSARNDEISENRAQRSARIQEQGLGRIPKKMAEKYPNF